MEATVAHIKELRASSGAGVGAVKEALEKSNTIDEAIQYLREKGIAKGAKRASKQASNGTLGIYVHNDNRMVAVVEVVSETDFASKSPDMQKFAKDLALHIAAVGPEYIVPEDVPEDVLEREKKVFAADVEGKPAEIAAKILEGKLAKFYEDTVLIKQRLFSDDSKTVEDYFNEMLGKLGEKIQITRMTRIKVGSPTTSCMIKLPEQE